MTDERALSIDELCTVEDVIAWLRGAEECCRETAQNISDPERGAYLTGRAEAFGLAAGLLRDVLRGAAE